MILSHLSQTTSWASCKASPHEKRKHHFLRLNLESSYGCMVLNAKTHTQTKLTKLLPFPHKFWTMMNYEQCIFARSCVRWSSDRQSNSAKIKLPNGSSGWIAASRIAVSVPLALRTSMICRVFLVEGQAWCFRVWDKSDSVSRDSKWYKESLPWVKDHLLWAGIGSCFTVETRWSWESKDPHPWCSCWRN